jgi:hypothetical protein
LAHRALVAYPALINPESPVYLASYLDGNVTQLRILARRLIKKHELLYALSGTTATDSLTPDSGLSSIEVAGDKKGRLLVGPIRFVNSDCKPNAAVRE